ncbi:MAG TPA: hypothetical protein VJ608_10620 [Albitalea sp.]|nr:hypothetical protein [Albitalea sp.]
MPPEAEAKSKAFFKKPKIKIVCCHVPNPIRPELPVEIKINGASTTDVAKQGEHVVGKVTGDAIREAGIGLANLERESRRISGQIDQNARMSGNDIGLQLKRSQKDIGDALTAVYHFALHETEETPKTFHKAERRFREGKVVDAIWHLTTDPVQARENHAADAAMESSVLSTVASVAASVYGTPAGAGAYAAWLAYHQTCKAGKCNPELALRVGLIAAAANAGNTAASDITEPLKKAAVMGAIAGAAVAASGGSPEDINRALFRAGASVIIEEGYRTYVGRDMFAESKGAFGEPMCMTGTYLEVGSEFACPRPPEYMKNDKGEFRMLDAKGQFHDVAPSNVPTSPSDWRLIGNASSTPAGTPVVGIQVQSLADKGWQYENSGFMTTVAKVPGMNAMALFHDRWTVNWSMTSTPAIQGSIPVAMVLVYTGETLAYDTRSSNAIVDAAVKADARSAKQGEADAPAVAASAATPAGPQPLLASDKRYPETILCTQGDSMQAFSVVLGREKDDLKCAVAVVKDNVALTDAPYYAKVQPEYCSVKIMEMADPLLKAGWSCKAR